MDEQEKERQSWAKFLNSDLTRHNLILGGLYLTSWELFRTVVIDTVRQFLANHPDRQSCIDSSYDTDVHYLNPRDRFHASCLWLQKMGAISDEDIARIVKIRNHRNQIAHELLAFISDVDHDIDVA